MKKHYLCILVLLAGSILASCTQEEDDLFGKSAAQRLNESVEEYSRLLEESPLGWALEFFPGDGSRGGHVYVAAFKDGDVELAYERSLTKEGNTIPADTPMRSKYSVIAEQGILLTFDTYNALLHYYSELRNSDDIDGYESDYEFIFQRVSENKDSIFLKGKKYGNEMVMVKLQENPFDYLRHVHLVDTAVAMVPRTRLIVDGVTYPVEINNKHLKYTENDSVVTKPYVYNNKGLRLYEPVTIGGNVIRNFVYDEVSGDVVAASAEAKIPYPTKLEQFIGAKATWNLVFDYAANTAEMNDEMFQLYKDNRAFSAFQTVIGWAIGFDSFYGNGIDEYPISIQYTIDMMGFFKQPAHFGVTLNAEGDNELVISAGKAGANYNFYSASLDPLTNYILDHSPYITEFNEGKIATRAKLISKNDPSVWFNLALTNE